MDDGFISLQALIAVCSFLALLVVQLIWPRRQPGNRGINRFIHNVLLFVLNNLVLRLLVPASVLLAAQWADREQLGLFNVLHVHPLLSVTTCVLLLDFAIYWQHVATHKIGWLWRLHRVHHADYEMDVTTAIRFHPVELVLSLLFKCLLVISLGAPLLAVIIFELLLFIGPAFNHSNINLRPCLDARLRWVVATPDVHRIHHSVYVDEQNTNYGFFLIWWDKLFNTYTQQPADGHQNMQIGLADKSLECERLDQMLTAPFR